MSISEPTSTIEKIRFFQEMAEMLLDDADWHRSDLVEQMGVRGYVAHALRSVAGRSAFGCQLLWPDGKVEVATMKEKKLGKYVLERAKEERSLPRAVVVDGRKTYL